MSTKRLDTLREIEHSIQELWNASRPYETEAGDLSKKDEHFFITFPYPYMNGRLHLGHAFSLTKCEFTARFQRLNGKHVLWPFAFHCTGMPIAASADKIRNELADQASGHVVEMEPDAADETAAVAKYASRRSKAVAKTGTGKTQSEILIQIGIPAEEVPRFADPKYWCKYFPPLGQRDLKLFGIGVDWRRSFITTDINPYYDRFIQWQFNLLKERNYLKFGLRPAVFSRVEEQPCTDHDRAVGEGVNPASMHVIALPVIEVPAQFQKVCANKDTFLLAYINEQGAELIAKPHFFLSPEDEFGFYYAFDEALQADDICSSEQNSFIAKREVAKDQLAAEKLKVYICPPRCAENLVFQGRLPADTVKCATASSGENKVHVPHLLASCTGKDLLGLETRTYDGCSTPMLTGKAVDKIDKGVKVSVSGVPSKTGDAVKTGDEERRTKQLAQLMKSGQCFQFYEPEKRVVSRSGADCVVALCNQWYSDFGNPDWKALVHGHVANGASFDGHGASPAYLRTISWLEGWACSRNYGLGTFLPWEAARGNKIVIESLSDSTIYFAYYTIAHFLQGDLYGETPGLLGVRPEELSREVFDYVYCQTDKLPTETTISAESLVKMRTAFEYWYPMSLRCSGKDLLTNHLTMSLFHHAAIWPNRPDLWPRSFFINGHILLNSEKMSKQSGNFLTLTDCMEKFSTDGTRVALADAGDSADDANFEAANAVSALMKLYLLVGSVEEYIVWKKAAVSSPAPGDQSFREGEKNELDLMFVCELESLAAQAHVAYSVMSMRDANKFAFYEQLSLRDWYRQALDTEPMHAESFERWIKVTALTLSPIAPHICEHIWSNLLGQPQLIVKEAWPVPTIPRAEAAVLHLKFALLNGFAEDVRKTVEKSNSKKQSTAKAIIGYVARSYPQDKLAVLQALATVPKDDQGIPLEPKGFLAQVKSDPAVQQICAENRKALPGLMAFASHCVRQAGAHGLLAYETTPPFDELEFFRRHSPYLIRSIGLPLQFKDSQEQTTVPKTGPATPGAPNFEIEF
ncbi:putative leucyl-tRNA synthetase [Gregarina niphandrodes]|uniref:leucine--tRNA ligase n=1 Tax=Gregarina niphandrodes TaxID=110365 RepID=A0A023AYY8_GRENI|nr:putative leucyl-tRNA synthetase [Gregarina niphandrodes]EZG43859.1 putative leucyl-tRNA synthetase [Gregarina niphandrodes]|eukprot:XP_011132947.1 putative leucyl-tRNA synthetase [Gregarina niphandrodes]